MARSIADINGVPVYSNKKMNSIVNSRISFTDGSWCDVETGEVVNNGEGYINIGTPPTGKNGKEETDTKKFTGAILDVKDLSATDLDVQPHSGTDIVVTKKGRKSDIEKIHVYQKGNLVIVEGEANQGGSTKIQVGNINISSIRGKSSIVSGSNIVMNNGSISVGGGSNKKDRNDTKVIIQVPRGMPVSITNIDGFSSVGDIEGPFRINTNTGEDARIGSVGDATVNIKGSSDVHIKAVRENLSVKTRGSGDVKVRRGEVNCLNVDIQGSGDFDFGGRAVDANISVKGSGDVDVDFVKNRPIINCQGSCDVEIGNW